MRVDGSLVGLENITKILTTYATMFCYLNDVLDLADSEETVALAEKVLISEDEQFKL